MNQPFTILRGVAAPLDRANVDTDAIIPARFMKTIKRSGLGAHLFDSWRYGVDGLAEPTFVLNQPAYRNTSILVANDNFGCGSSREHAVWALADFGIRCVIAPGFAEIFQNNAMKNGLLPVVLQKADVRHLLDSIGSSPGVEITVDLPGQCVKHAGARYEFDIDHTRKDRLVRGVDDIGMTLLQEDAIRLHEIRQRRFMPWLFNDI
ncbi:3-isopropylmalate dehydratase small subunit [Massilia sp. METH4]|uniref:3-isopropylmalate dehydratase small subunit n=1 Tax=Massilia sp. METH4 TaxID=3123041 RepID=UPI0030CE8AD5